MIFLPSLSKSISNQYLQSQKENNFNRYVFIDYETNPPLQLKKSRYYSIINNLQCMCVCLHVHDLLNGFECVALGIFTVDGLSGCLVVSRYHDQVIIVCA